MTETAHKRRLCKADPIRYCAKRVEQQIDGVWMCDMHRKRFQRYGADVKHKPWGIKNKKKRGPA